MGAGYHGGFGNTRGAVNNGRAIAATSTFLGDSPGDNLKKFAFRITEDPGFTDVVIHGTASDVQIYHNGRWVHLDQRRLSTMLKHDSGYPGGPIRLISCNTGRSASGIAQNLANKMGVNVKAPTDTLWVFPNGKITIGPSQNKDTGTWKTYYPNNKKG